MPDATDTARDALVPLAVDLDGTLIRTDMVWESLVRFLRQNPFALPVVLGWWLRGRAFLKQQLAARVRIDPATLPYNQPFLLWLKEQKRAGRKLLLATASDAAMAKPIAAHVGVFDDVLASNGTINLRDQAKLTALTARFGERGFDYAGNSAPDLDVWKGARQAVVVNASDGLSKRASAITSLGPIFPTQASPLLAWLRCVRPHQWIKNLIVFVPAIAAHQLGEANILATATRAFVAFCLAASAGYLVNDLLDLEADRQHATKRNRPFASGQLPLPAALFGAPVLLAAALGISFPLSTAFAGVIALYFFSTVVYSWRFKQFALFDVFVLAALYTMRLVAGHVATGVRWSAWLLVFSMFVFLSLALMKRFQELHAVRQQNRQAVQGRGYTAADLELVATFGLVSGCIAVLVLALYVNSEQVVKLYAHPTLLLLVCPLLLYWIARVWFLAHRGQMHDDPVAFAFKDWVSYAIGALTLAVMWLATGR